MSKSDRNVTLRRTIEQVIHCMEEASSVLEHGEDPRCSLDDVDQAQVLIREVVRPGVEKIVSVKSPEIHYSSGSHVQRSACGELMPDRVSYEWGEVTCPECLAVK